MADDGKAGASSSSLSPAPWLWATSSSSEGGMYDVFLNFRGEDTRFLFTDYLYHGLADVKKLEVFRDDPGLELGDEIKPTLMEAIKRSRIHIVVMSENYVSSSWCLLELEQMLKYSNNGTKRPVFPVFYHVTPAEVRYQINTKSKEAMEKHEKREGKDKAEAWKLALSTVCGLSGQHIQEKHQEKYETEVIGKIAEQVSAKLLEIKQQLNRFDSQFEVVESLLNLESCDTVRVVGIYEDQGGKSYITTFAFELYYKIKDEFRAASFVVDVGKHLMRNTADDGLEYLKKELLSDMVVETKQELQHKRVLLVLEGVDSEEQLELLEGMRIVDWFGPGSRIIITTENKDLFQNYSPVMNGVELETHCIREGEMVGSNWIVKEKHVVGFVKDFIDVINQLREEDSKRRNVVSIVGMGGSGKTTLAQKIYDSKVVREVFPLRAWATVSKDYREKEVFSSLFRCLMPSKPIPENEQELKSKVRRCLNEKRRKYLVILDDVWDIQVWDKLKDYVLPNKNNGSRILVTTRNDQVANYARSKEPHHKLLLLNEEECWELIYNEVFGGEECPPDLEPIGKSIADGCKGLPLAIKTTAGIVAKRERSEDEWKKIKNLLPHWCVAEDKEGKKMMEILKLSYDDLSEKMKPCFLYLGVFPEDVEIRVRDLIEVWIAERLIEPIQSGRSKVAPEPDDIGEQYLKELVDRNLVQVASRRSDGKGVKTCKIHDLIRELCISESNSNNARRLSFPRDIGSYACSVTCHQSCTYSLFIYGDAKGWSHHIPQDCRVNVLYIMGWIVDLTSEKNVENLKELKSVKFLKIDRFYPNGLSKLESIQTLHIMGDVTPRDLSIIEGLKQLRHFRGVEVCLLVDKDGVKNKMHNLQTLLYVHVDSRLGFLLNNDYFPNLRTLGVSVTEEERHSAEKTFSSLHCLSNLQKLKLELPISESFPIPVDKIAFPSNLSKLTISYFDGLKSQDMNALAQIPGLKILKFNDVSCIEKILNCGTDRSFLQLQVFIMIRVRVKCLTLKDGAMPCLRRAVFHDCPGLELKDLPQQMRSLGCNLHFTPHDDVDELMMIEFSKAFRH
ncbi:disease resistance protein RPP13 [Arachis duranensis]|uniref:Disease resistance protein RPP13 n=1 Tax=Arachis duranensis TaxID=130453 RepID=A0A6P5NQR8_ARADU|nr:disease resistance protein RPP13 [Arachis duranensis]